MELKKIFFHTCSCENWKKKSDLVLQHFEIRRNGEGFHLLYFGWKSHICVGILVKQGFFSCCVINKDADLHPLSVSFYPTAGGGNDPTSMEPRSLFFFSCGWVPNTACCSTQSISAASLWPSVWSKRMCVCVCVGCRCVWLTDWCVVLCFNTSASQSLQSSGRFFESQHLDKAAVYVRVHTTIRITVTWCDHDRTIFILSFCLKKRHNNNWRNNMYEEGNLSGATAELEEGFVVLQEILRYSYTGGKQFILSLF